jgi:hypothetical protein
MDTHLGCNWPDEHELAPPLTLCYGTGSGQLSGSLGSLAPTVGPTLLGDLNRGVLPHCIALRLCCGCPRSLTTALTAVLPLSSFLYQLCAESAHGIFFFFLDEL